ncbi:MAG: RNB domain-containing ribonuclease [Chloroflexota bacterium]
MNEAEVSRDSLVLYKNRPARVTQMGQKKIEIALPEGDRLSVRHKDVLLLHPGPLANLHHLRTAPADGEVKTAWELLTGTTTTLADLSDLAYGEFTPQTAWALWQMVTDGLYFSGEPDAIRVHTAESVTTAEADRAAKAAEEAAWLDFLGRVEANQTDPADDLFLREVEDLALGRRSDSRVLRTLGRGETAENGHQLLLALGYWDEFVNPHPSRLGVAQSVPDLPLPSLPDEPRQDLTHLTALAIDDEGSRDPDDALSWENGRLWVHVADAAALVVPDSPADQEARARGASLYLPEGTIPMLPRAAVQQLGLGLHEVSPALSFAIDLDEAGGITAVEVMASWVRVTRLSYAEAETRLEESPLRELHALAQQHETRRRLNEAIAIDLPEVKIRVREGEVVIRPLPLLHSRALVQEAMLMTGEAAGHYAVRHQIPIPYSSQTSTATPEEIAVSQGDPTYSQMFALRRTMKASQRQTSPGPHAGLGMAMYVQATSPLRRYLDLVVHQQFRAHLRGEAPLDSSALTRRIGMVEAITGDMRRAERLSNAHWTLVYLQQQGEWRGEGVIVDKRGSRDVVLIPDLDWEANIYSQRDLPLDSPVQVALNEVDLPNLEAHFRYV